MTTVAPCHVHGVLSMPPRFNGKARLVQFFTGTHRCLTGPPVYSLFSGARRALTSGGGGPICMFAIPLPTPGALALLVFPPTTRAIFF